MQIKSYNREQLREFIQSGFYKGLDKIPISYHRALSHIHNPDCEDEDILLWVAYDNGLLAGYAGVLPGMCRIKEADEKIYWLSCFWVDESYREQHVASLLFFPLIKKYKDKLFISNFVPALEKTYQRLGIFQPTVYKTGFRFYLRFCFIRIIVTRLSQAPFLVKVSGLFDNLLNLPFSVRALFYKKLKKNFKVVESSSFDGEFQSLVDSLRPKGGYIKRDSEHFDWILNYPWVLEGKPDKESRRYFFSSRSVQFGYCSWKFYGEKDLLGYVLLKIRDGALTVSYIYAHDTVIKDIAVCILEKAKKDSLKMITTFDERLAGEISKRRCRYLVSKKVKRPYIIAKKTDIASLSFQEGDGDSVFT